MKNSPGLIQKVNFYSDRLEKFQTSSHATPEDLLSAAYDLIDEAFEILEQFKNHRSGTNSDSQTLVSNRSNGATGNTVLESGYDVEKGAYVTIKREEDHMVELLRAENSRLLQMLDDDVESCKRGSTLNAAQVRRCMRVRGRLMRVERFVRKFLYMRSLIEVACHSIANKIDH